MRPKFPMLHPSHDQSVDRYSTAATRRLRELPPELGDWTSFALWYGLAAASTPPTEPPTSAELSTIVDQRLAPLLLLGLREHDRQLDPAQMDQLRSSAFSWTTLTQAVMTQGARAIADLQRGGLRLAVSKGPGVGAYYPAAHTRPFSDLDLLIAGPDVSLALDRLRSAGWAEADRNQQPWSYFDRHCREGINLERAVGEGLDIHHRLPPWLWSQGLHLTDLIDRSAPIDVPGSDTIPALSAEDNLLVTALHVVSDKNAPGQTLIIWRDLAVLAARSNVDQVCERADRAGLAGWLRAVLTALPTPVRPDELIGALSADVIPHARRLNALLSTPISTRHVIRSQVLRLPVRNGAAFVAGMLVPSRAFLATKFPDTPNRYLRWLRSPIVE